MRALRGTMRVVADKSITHRGVLLSALSEGESLLRNPNDGADCRASLEVVRELGVRVEVTSEGWRMQGGRGQLHGPRHPLDFGNSGTGIRLGAGLLAGLPFRCTLDGDASLRSRPMERVLDPLRRMGAWIEASPGGRAPFTIEGGVLAGMEYHSPIASAQVKSALLLAALSLRDGVFCFREPERSRDHTERLLTFLGVLIREVDGALQLAAGARPCGRDFEVPGDVSAAVFFLVAAAITPGSDLEIVGVGTNPTRTGAFDVLTRMGAALEILDEPTVGPEPIGRLRMRASRLQATTVSGSEVPRLIDEIPVLAVAAAAAEGTTWFRDVAELRVKESDRIRSTVSLLRSLGAEVEEQADAFAVHGPTRFQGSRIETFGDHRIAMSALVAGCSADGEVTLDDESMIATSDPEFRARLERLQGEGR